MGKYNLMKTPRAKFQVVWLKNDVITFLVFNIWVFNVSSLLRQSDAIHEKF